MGQFRRDQDAAAAERLRNLQPAEWTRAPRGQVLEAFGCFAGSPVTVVLHHVKVEDRLQRLADRIVAEG